MGKSMTIGKRIFEFLAEHTGEFKLLNYMFKDIAMVHKFEGWGNFRERVLVHSCLIKFEWDCGAFLFFLRGLERELSTHGVHSDCRTWPFLVVVETLWATITHESKPSYGGLGVTPEAYVQWGKLNGYL